MAKVRILVVDDDPDLCELIHDALSDTYTVEICHSAAQAIPLQEQIHPSIVILDINLPGESGLTLCKQLSQIQGNPPIILLISGDNSLDLRLEAYKSGGADFMPKPFKIQELRIKVDALEQFFTRSLELKQSSEFASQTAMHAMVEASQYGEVLRFYNNMYRADTVESVKDAFFGLMANFGLRCSIQLRVLETYSFDCDHSECSPIELQIFDNLHDSDRLISFSNRVMINGKYSSIIVKNMPINDETENGRLRDILATMIDGVDAKLLDLQRLSLLRQTSSELALSSQRLTKVMKGHEEDLSGAMNHVISQINASFHTLELTEKQEDFFTGLTEQVLNSMEENFIHIGNECDILECLRLSLGVVLDGSNYKASE